LLREIGIGIDIGIDFEWATDVLRVVEGPFEPVLLHPVCTECGASITIPIPIAISIPKES
jgi:hypothetical protein